MTLDARVVVRRDAFALEVGLAVPAGDVIAVVGPNGAGKSTLLRARAGLIGLDDGRIEVEGAVWDHPDAHVWLPPEHRRVGLVFSDHLLFPHLSAVQNVAFGPRARGARRAAATTLALTWLDRFGVADLAARRPAELSGGQAQRVALARALATNPTLLLLDEPLAALDASTRVEARHVLREHLADWHGTCVLVTHDPVDATVLADHLVVLEGGQAVQAGTPSALARAPLTPWGAALLGLNVYRGTSDGTVVALAGGGQLVPADAPHGPVVVTVAPAAIALHTLRPEGSPRNVWPVTVTGIEHAAHTRRVHLDGVPSARADLTGGAVDELGLVPGVRVWASVKATEVVVEAL